MPDKIIFLCTGNSCRSQMAEGFARHLAGDLFEVYSAGTSPAGVNPLAIKVMEEIGIDISKQTSDLLDPEIIGDGDVVVTLCGDALESCPVINAKKIHWPLKDPAKIEGEEQEVLEGFRQIRDQIAERVQDLIKKLRFDN